MGIRDKDKDKDKDQLEPEWLTWLGDMDQELRYFFEHDVPGIPEDPWSAAGLRHAEQAALEYFPTVAAAQLPDSRRLVDRFHRFIGEVFVRRFEAKWMDMPRSELASGRRVDRKLRPVVKVPFQFLYFDVAPPLTVAIGRRTGKELEFFYDSSKRQFSEWLAAGRLGPMELADFRNRAGAKAEAAVSTVESAFDAAHATQDIGVPPFEPDRPVPASVQVISEGENPTALLASLGVELPSLRIATSIGSDGPAVWVGALEPGSDVAGLWQAIRNHYDQTGWWPLLVNADTWRRVGPRYGVPEHQSRVPMPAGELATAVLDGANWFTTAYSRLVREHKSSIRRSAYTLSAEDLGCAERFGWPDMWSVIGGKFDQLALIPSPNPWLVPGLLRWSGSCNADIGSVDHASVLRRWFARWGCEPIALGWDTLTLRVDVPPSDDDAALRAALEFFLYCGDEVLEGVGSLDALKPKLVTSLWQLWWD